MKTEFSFMDVRRMLEDQQSADTALLEAFDALSGVTFAILPLLTGAGVAALPFIGVKNELVKAGRYVMSKLAARPQKETPIDRCRRLQLAYAMTCHVSLCEATSDTWYKIKRDLKLEADKQFTIPEGLESDTCEVSQPREYSFPFATDDLASILDSLKDALHETSKSLNDYIKSTNEWSGAPSKVRKAIESTIESLPQKGRECFRANLVELASKFPDFHIWIHLFRDEALHDQLSLAADKLNSALVVFKESRDKIDVGLEHLGSLVSSVPESIRNDSADRIIAALQKRYAAKLDEPIVRESASRAVSELTFPKIREIFIPQSFKAILRRKDVRLELESTWSRVKSYDELGPYLLHTLESPYSFGLPLVILGHPGSGKSLLSEVVASRLLGDRMFPIRVPLRDINADGDIQTQIEQWIRKYTGEACQWTQLSQRLIEIGRPPLVILDGYDELLQASGRVFSNYIVSVQRFLEREEQLGRCARAIVTSRMMLIDKATIPEYTIVVRLDPFDEKKRNQWIDIWNKANQRQFKKAGVREFQLPKAKSQIADLATQPLLLLMLALYDSEDNALAKSETLDQTALYDDLLRQFIRREKTKGDGADEFNSLSLDEQAAAVEHDLERLGIAAIGMFNRRSLQIGSNDLNDDICFFQMDEPLSDGPGKHLTAAEKLLGSFFFVHQAQGGDVQNLPGVPSSFEFLHNTFGEYLTANFILRRVMDEVEDVQQESSAARRKRKSRLDQRLEQANAFSPEWFACLSHTPLHSRPVVLEMLREWSKHEMRLRNINEEEVIYGLDVIVDNQLQRLLNNTTPPSLFSRERPTPFPRFPLVGHLAIYSLNLIVLRIVLVRSEYHVNQGDIGTHEDGTSPWEQLTYLWRSWFSLDNLAALTNVFSTEFKEGIPILRQFIKFTGASPSAKPDLVRSVAKTLGDDVTQVLAASCFGAGDRDEVFAIQGVIPRAELPLPLSIVVRTIEECGHKAFKDLLPAAVELALQNPEAEAGAQQRLYYLAEQYGYENELFELLRRGKLLHEWVRSAPASLVVGLGLWCIVRGDEAGFDILNDVLGQQRDVAMIGQAIRHARRSLNWPSYKQNILRVRIRPPHRLNHDPESLRHIPPVIALEFIRLAREIGDHRWAHEAFGHFLRRDPEEFRHISLETTLECVRIARDIGDRRRLEEAWRHLLRREPEEIRYISPVIAFEFIRLAREMGDHRWAVEALQWLLRHDPENLRRMSSQTALEYIRLARELGDRSWAEEAWRYFPRRREPESLRRMSPQTALEYIRLARELGDRGWAEEAWRHFPRRDPEEFRRMSPQTALEYIRLARELGDRGWAEEAWRHFFRRNPEEFLRMSPEMALECVRLPHELDDRDWTEEAWRMLFADRDPNEFGQLITDKLLDLLHIAQYVGDCSWLMRAGEAWRSSSNSFAKLVNDGTLMLLNQVAHGHGVS